MSFPVQTITSTVPPTTGPLLSRSLALSEQDQKVFQSTLANLNQTVTTLNKRTPNRLQEAVITTQDKHNEFMEKVQINIEVLTLQNEQLRIQIALLKNQKRKDELQHEVEMDAIRQENRELRSLIQEVMSESKQRAKRRDNDIRQLQRQINELRSNFIVHTHEEGSVKGSWTDTTNPLMTQFKETEVISYSDDEEDFHDFTLSSRPKYRNHSNRTNSTHNSPLLLRSKHTPPPPRKII